MALLVSMQASSATYFVNMKVGEAKSCVVTSIISGRTYNWSVTGSSYIIQTGGGYTGSAFFSFIASQPGSVTIQCTGTSGGTFANYYSDTWYITIEPNTPSSVSVAPNSLDMDLGATTEVTASVYPANAEFDYLTWTSDDESVVTVTAGTGTTALLTAVGIGTTTITCAENNGMSGTCTVTVWGTGPTGITLSGPTTMMTDETAQLSYDFTPANHHSSITWTSSNPSVATIDQSGLVSAVSDGTVTMTATTLNGLTATWPMTVNKAPMTLKASLGDGYVERDDEVTLTASKSDAEIRYTLDGTEPTTSSLLYTDPIVISQTLTLWAKAFKKGYETPVVKHQYKVTAAMTKRKFPYKEELYLYGDINPYVSFEHEISPGSKFGTAKVVCDGMTDVAGEFIINGCYLVFVPTAPLVLGHAYTIVLEEGTVTANGDPNKAMQWSFTTGEFIRGISAGFEQAAAVRTDNDLLFWGRRIDSYDGGDFMESSKLMTPQEFASDVSSVSCGFTHNMFIGLDGQTSGWGLQYCGEIGDGTSEFRTLPSQLSSVTTDKLMAGGQATAFMKDGQLRMAGRNDFGQVGDTVSVAYQEPVSYDIAGGVTKVIPGWQTTMALSANGTLYGWGDNTNGLLADGTWKQSITPKTIMSSVADFGLSRWSNSNAAAVTADGTLYVWGLNDKGQLGNGSDEASRTPITIMDGVRSVEVGTYFMAAIKTDGSLWTWGDNSYGQLGNGTTADASIPQKIMDDVDCIELGNQFAIALKKDGSVWTWGRNEQGQLGIGVSDDYSATPTQILKGRCQSAITGVDIDNQAITIGVGERAVVCAAPKPLTANYTQWQWKSSDETIAIVNERGVITGVGEGTTTVTVTIDNMSATCTVVVGVPPYTKGDVNGDGDVDIADAVCIVNHIVGKPNATFFEDAADVNNDGDIDIADAVHIVNLIVGKISALAPCFEWNLPEPE